MAAQPSPSLALAKDERVHLAGLLNRVVGWRSDASVRLITTERAVGLYFDAPMGVLVFIALPLARPGNAVVDRVVSAHRLRDVLGDVAAGVPAEVEVTIPDAREMPAALAVLPSREGWIAAEKATASEVSEALDAATAARDKQAEALAAATDEARSSFESQWWEAPLWGGLPTKAVYAARALGMIAHPGARVESATRAGWKRLVTPAGQVFVVPPETYSGIALSVVR